MRSFGAIILLCALLTACVNTPPESKELSERAVTSLLAGSSTKAPVVVNAIGVQQAIGTPSMFGPTDYEYFGSARLPPDTLETFVSAARPISQRPEYVRPQSAAPWWPNKQKFSTLEFLEHPSPSPGIVGWIAVDRESGTVYFVLGTT